MNDMAHDGGNTGREVEITIKPNETDLELALDAAAAANANQLAAMKREIAQLEEQVRMAAEFSISMLKLVLSTNVHLIFFFYYWSPLLSNLCISEQK
jgi:hypothetical protein